MTDDELEAAIAEVVERAGPLFTDAAEFARHVALCVSGTDDVADALRSCQAADLSLAFGCARGSAAAVTEFRRRFAPEIARVIRKYPSLRTDGADIAQEIFARLLVAREDAPPRIADYRGAGPLQGWVRVAALRVTLDRVRARDRLQREASQATPPTPGVEEHYIKHAYADAIRDSVEAAFGGLTPRERNLLRHSVVQGLSIDQIAPIYGVHRATIARWLARVRASLAEKTQAHLARTQSLDPAEIPTLLRAAQSRLDLTLSRLLKDD